MRIGAACVRPLGLVALVSMLGMSACSSSGNDNPTSEKDDQVGDVRGFDGTTIKVASIGIKSQLPGTEYGAKGRIKRFNDTNEINGVKIEYAEFVDDKIDPATALSEARRLVTDTGVFAIVGDVSAVNPGEYLAQQKVPYFGYAFDYTYCSKTPNSDAWGFGITGCLVPKDPSAMPDSASRLLQYVKQETGKDKPTVALFSADVQSGRDTVKFQTVSYGGAGFDVVFNKGILPPPPVSDYTAYVQQLLSSNGGRAPDVIQCFAQTDCIPMYKQLRSSGFTGVFGSNLYSDLLVQQMSGSVVANPFANLGDANPAKDQMKADVTAVKADQVLETGSVAGYLSTDMFIQALKTAAKDGKAGITPENVQKAAASQTWEMKNFAGPTRYPDSTVAPTPSCSTVLRTDGTKWETVVPFQCSDKKFPVAS
jgi:branched-chain amino acid transport system substrate-binding protein